MKIWLNDDDDDNFGVWDHTQWYTGFNPGSILGITSGGSQGTTKSVRDRIQVSFVQTSTFTPILFFPGLTIIIFA